MFSTQSMEIYYASGGSGGSGGSVIPTLGVGAYSPTGSGDFSPARSCSSSLYSLPGKFLSRATARVQTD